MFMYQCTVYINKHSKETHQIGEGIPNSGTMLTFNIKLWQSSLKNLRYSIPNGANFIFQGPCNDGCGF